ncbi:uncharacterized protein HD556DRAFT_1451701 [Suillus plorans]|uniref:Uncharacterized protein n=1 Tax=Suillus plorans TaxID=116603 RepID=A0A9P7D9Z9_9AGAM|nr:uncharacterized protein HD556DRAFT_1451701 [Suillus plorans]KAG1784502.1 hypothetical protein HD556DRAFT_1451701 [Suillus plorans]
MATTLPTGPIASGHSLFEFGSERMPDSMTPLATPDPTVSRLPQIRNWLAKLVLSKNPDPSSSVLAPYTHMDPDPTTTKLSMATIPKDAILPTKGYFGHLQQKPECTVSNCILDMLTDCFLRPYRNLCAHRWLNIIAPNGTSGDFKLYLNALSKDSQLNYELEAAALVKDWTWTGNTVYKQGMGWIGVGGASSSLLL